MLKKYFKEMIEISLNKLVVKIYINGLKCLLNFSVILFINSIFKI